jgi:hypothetical protein
MFDENYIKDLFNLKFPKYCSDWTDAIPNDLNEYGNLLHKFDSKRNNLNDQHDIARMICLQLEEEYSDEQLTTYIKKFNEIKKQRDLIIESDKGCLYYLLKNNINDIPTLSEENKGGWGSKKQYLYGYICQYIFKKNNIDLPIFLCSLLNPTGGICGPGNFNIYNGSVNSPIIIHSAIHDAAGYCYNYHNIGPGYNYLGKWFELSTSSPLSGQVSGLEMCIKINLKLNL